MNTVIFVVGFFTTLLCALFVVGTIFEIRRIERRAAVPAPIPIRTPDSRSAVR